MNVLAIGAHFDDIELGCGGTLIKHISQKDKVYMLVVTGSEYKDYNGKVFRTKTTALKEGKEAASIMGVAVSHLMLGGFKTQRVPYSVELIEKINKIIDELKIDTIYTHWIYDVHQDHSAVGRATLNAARHVPRVLMYRSNWYATAADFRGNFFVDISDYIKIKIKAIRAHKSEYKKFGEKWINFIEHQDRNSGIEMETKYAETFEVVKYLY
jgi:LmbE family N-acetylglucosaminyl deacetylase